LRDAGNRPKMQAMSTLLVLRHAQAAPEEPHGTDEDRPLTEDGLRAAAKIGRLVKDEQLLPALLLSSSARRTRETVERFVASSGYSGPVRFLDELYLAEASAIVDVLEKHAGAATRVLLVGHNPGLEDLIARLTGESVSLPTAALVECAFELDDWSALGASPMGHFERLFRANR
jgi:phosphohistidine phosphatase